MSTLEFINLSLCRSDVTVTSQIEIETSTKMYTPIGTRLMHGGDF